MKTTHVEQGLQDMSYEIHKNSFGMEMPLSKPAAFRFTKTPEKDVDGLQDRLECKGFSPMRPYEKESGDKFYVDMEVLTSDFKKIKVKLWRESVRIYPREPLPTKGELAQLTHAIELAFSAALEYEDIHNE